MYNVKSFVDLVDVESSVFISDKVFSDTVQTEEPCVLISAKDLYRMIHGRSQSLKDKSLLLSEFLIMMYKHYLIMIISYVKRSRVSKLTSIARMNLRMLHS